jgi:hypothetical protein
MIVVEPALTPLTMPAIVAFATPVFVDCHVADAVTSCVVPSDIEARAANWEAVPTAGAFPVTVTDATVTLGDDGEVLDDVELPLHEARKRVSVSIRFVFAAWRPDIYIGVPMRQRVGCASAYCSAT